jgi:hypothetical protein
MVAVPTIEEEDAKASEPRAGKTGRRTHTHHQPDEGGIGSARHPRLQAGAS